MTQHTYHEYGVVYPDGREDWNVAVWFGTIEDPSGRHRFREQYEMTQKLMGATVGELTFLHRKKVESFSEPDVVEDPPYVEETPEPLESQEDPA
jgi:hypothetical protein